IIGRAEANGPGKVAFVFPGQGAQHPDMARQTALYLAELRGAIQTADELLAERYDGPLSGYIWPPAAFSPEEESRNQDRLKDSWAAQPAIGAVSAGFLDLMLRLGLKPDLVAGHSYGEYTALHAAGVLSRTDFLNLSEQRGRFMAAACQVHGAMAMVQSSREEVERFIEDFEGVVLANHNTPRQSVISGEQNQVERVVDHLTEAGVRTVLLPVAGAFHSILMKPAQAALSQAIAAADLNPPQIPVFSSVTARPYTADRAAIQAVLDKQLLNPVEFVALIEKMYSSGARVFVELGPRTILCGLIGRILKGRDHLAVAAEGAGGGLRGLLIMLGRLIGAGLDIDPRALFAGRPVEPLDLDRLVETTSRPARSQTTWLVDGDCAWPASQASGRLGRAPLLTAKTAQDQSYPLLGQEPFSLDPALTSDLAAQDKDLLEAYLNYQKTMRQFLDVQERIMRQVLSGQPPAAAEPPPPFPAEAITPAKAPSPLETPAEAGDGEAAAGAGPERAELIETLRQLISQRTGYPTDMLGLDLDLEAELGVDSIKRVEILGQLQSSLSLAQAEGVRERMETLSQAKSITALTDIILQALPETEDQPIEALAGPAGPDQRPVKAEPPPLALAAEDGCSRYVMTAWAEAFPRIELSRPEGLFIITDGGAEISSAIDAELTSRGAKTALLGPDVLASAEKIFQAVADLSQAHGPVRGVVHLAPLAASVEPESLAQWKDLTQQEVRSLFLILQAAAGDLTRPDLPRMGRVLAASRLGGLFGRGGHLGPGLPTAGGCQGLLKTIGREWFRVLPKALDFDDQIAPADLARIVAEELLLPGGQVEVGYPEGRRTIFTPVHRPIEAGAETVRPEEDWVVLITGGARGITARTALTLIRPGMRLIIVGKSPLPPPEPAHVAEIAAPDQLRRRLIDQTRRKGQPQTPAQVEAQLTALIHGREMQANLAGFREMGAMVEYKSVDVR
ncbi:MAG: acyltransferase domain-containing protein, partial [Deltaproteobacteria bacterium]|nr:acyltransferase domain-containing protein [Deltaproteobacteria bacterium]